MAAQAELDSDRNSLKSGLALPNLESLDRWLTTLMAHQQIQSVIKGDGLAMIADRIVSLGMQVDVAGRLVPAAMLGRISAVARGRESEVVEQMRSVLISEPGPIDSLPDGEAKFYAAVAVASVTAPWVLSYSLSEAVRLDTADKARRELLKIAIERTETVEQWAHLISDAASNYEFEPGDTTLRRNRRTLAAMLDVLKGHEGALGSDPGSAVSRLFFVLVKDSAKNAESEVLHQALDSVLGLVARMIEIRFSCALRSDTYRPLVDMKKGLLIAQWSRFLEVSAAISKLRTDLLEAALVLARQNRTDKEILKAIEAVWPGLSQISSAVKRHFSAAQDLDSEVANYWLKVGRVTVSERSAEHRLGNTEDQQIGELLIQLQANRESMGKLSSAVVPVLKTFDVCQAATVQRAANGYESVAQIAERIARMRKLSKTDMVGRELEYNPIEHDMEGGHRSGIRRVKVVRDGILKDFAGRKKTLVKPRVEPIE